MAPGSTARRTVAALALLAVAGAAQARCPDGGAVAPADRRPGGDGVFSVQLDNDLFAGNRSNRDRYYTQGLRLSWASGPRTLCWLPTPLAALLELPDGFDPAAAQRVRRYGLSLGQNIYTPENKTAKTLVPTDRPYAGWLYAGFALQSTVVGARGAHPPEPLRQDTFQIEVGIVGPSALGRQAQNGWHEFIGVPKARGWSNQLHDEPGVVLTFERKWRALRTPLLEGAGGPALEADMVPVVGVSLGNVLTAATAGVQFRVGRGLASDFGPPRIRPALPGSDAFETDGRFGWHLFAGIGGEAVARNIFLDGNTFRRSHSVERNLAVADFQLGASATYDRHRVSLIHVFRTPEFSRQKNWHQFGALSWSVGF